MWGKRRLRKGRGLKITQLVGGRALKKPQISKALFTPLGAELMGFVWEQMCPTLFCPSSSHPPRLYLANLCCLI